MLTRLLSPSPKRIRIAAQKSAIEAVDAHVLKKTTFVYTDALASILADLRLAEEPFLHFCLAGLYERLNLDPVRAVAEADRARHIAELLRKAPREPYLIKRLADALCAACQEEDIHAFQTKSRARDLEHAHSRRIGVWGA